MTRAASVIRIAVFAAGLILPTAGSLGQTPEFRAMWVSRFEWPDTDPATCKATIDAVMENLKANNFNAVFFQIRGQCDTLYPSPEEVWSLLVGGADPGWNPLAYALSAAHANGIEFHAYINTQTCWRGSGGYTLPANPNHLFYSHCNAADPDHHDWLICGSQGTPVQWSGGYVWMAPGIPDFQAYWRRQVMHVVQDYEVDGVHFDYIRTPGAMYSYDPISRARQASPQSNPDNLEFGAWTADQITRMVRDIYAQVMAVKPAVKVSAAVFSNPNTAPSSVYQDALVWAQTGGMDILVPMMYYAGGAGSGWDTTLQTWLAGSAGRHVVAGHSTEQGVAGLLGQVDVARTRGAQGTSVFSYSSFTGWSDYLTNVHQQPVSTPAMTWKSSPTTGIIYGYVKDASGTPIVDAQLVRSGSTYKALSSGDGLYSFLLVPPGTCTLTVSHIGYEPADPVSVSVTAGGVVRQDITLGSLLPPLIAPVTPNPDFATRNLTYTRQLTLSRGTAESWTLLQGPDGTSLNRGTGCVQWVPLPCNAGSPVTFAVRVSSTAGTDDETWTVQVQAQPPCSTFNLTGFEDYANGTRVVFKTPRSSNTYTHLATTPNVAQVTDAVPGLSGNKCYVLQWQYVDATKQRWARVTTSNAPNIPNPTVQLDRPIRLRLRLDSGRLRLALGIRETGTTADLGGDGGTSGSIEFLGAATKLSDAPQGVLVEPMEGVWQTLIFDPRRDPIVAYTGDSVLSSASNKGTLECLAFSYVDSVGPFTVYLDDVDFVCDTPGDFDYDEDVDQGDFGHFQACLGTTGATAAALGDCRSSDFDRDGDVDTVDFGGFQCCFNGADQPAGCR
ncbi:MAG TPA: family 10 glycosylhydrolase [Phycisphaerae bacterium]|nr:family 10 glycosylhydrolase [Phycisphaerae bacterium]HRY70070.1 family 10 glycosylhydrolase [Phycisphaerae bacterium]HSA27346.1 family 10 glycosylhydrolase [Phycisphaerae bacterium]